MQDEEARIDALIRSVQRKRQAQEVAVSDETVHAYLTGRATAAQKSEVRQALLRSAEFRKELLALSAQLEELASDEAMTRFEAAVAPPPPADLLQRSGKTTRFARDRTVQERIGAALDGLLAPVRALGQALQLRVLVPVGAAAVLVLAIIPRLTWSPIIAPVGTTAMDPSVFATAPGLSRGAVQDHEEAARLELRRWIRLRDGSLVFEPPVPGATGAVAGQRVEIELVGAWRRKLRTVELVAGQPPSLPGAGEPPHAPQAIAWLALLPQEDGVEVELRSYPLLGRSTAVRWDAEGSERGVLVVTYERDGHIEASPCVLVDLDSR